MVIKGNNFKNRFIALFFNKEKRVVYVYTFSHIMSVFVAFIITLLLTNWMDPDVYGKYKYATSILLTLPAFVEFGLHFCTSRIVAEDKGDEAHPVVPISILLMVSAGLLLTIGLFSLTIVQTLIGITSDKTEALNSVSIIFPFFFVFTSNLLISHLFQGTGKIYQLSLYSLIKYLLILIGIGIQYFVKKNITFEYCILLFILSHLTIQLPTLFRTFSKGLSKIKFNTHRLIDDIKSFGIKIYLSSIATTGTSSLIGLISGAIYGYKEYGYYSLALSLAQFFSLISSSMAVVSFRKNVISEHIDKNDLYFMYGSNIFIYVFFILNIDWIFKLVFPQEYTPSILYLKILGLSYILSGMTLYYNRFFVARKLSNILLKNSLKVSVVNVLLSSILIPRYNILGLVMASCFSSIFNLLQYIFEYKKYRQV